MVLRTLEAALQSLLWLQVQIIVPSHGPYRGVFEFVGQETYTTEGSTEVQIEVRRTVAIAGHVNVTLIPGTENSAVFGVDYSFNSSWIPFAPNQTTGTFTMQILHDETPELAESVVFTLGVQSECYACATATLGERGTHTVYIDENEDPYGKVLALLMIDLRVNCRQ